MAEFNRLDKEWLEAFSKDRVERIQFLLVRQFMHVKAVAVTALTNIKRIVSPREPVAVFLDRFARMAAYTEYDEADLLSLLWRKLWHGMGKTLEALGGTQGITDYQNRAGGADDPLPLQLDRRTIRHHDLTLPREVPVIRVSPVFIRYLIAREESVESSVNSQLSIIQQLEERVERAERAERALREAGVGRRRAEDDRRGRAPNHSMPQYQLAAPYSGGNNQPVRKLVRRHCQA